MSRGECPGMAEAVINRPVFAKRAIVITSLIVLFFLTLFLVVVVDLFTFRIKYEGHWSGNGNPALLFVFLLLPVYAVFLSLLGITSRSIFAQRMEKGFYHYGLIGFLTLLGLIQVGAAALYKDLVLFTLSNTPFAPDPHGLTWGHWNQYSNTAYVNGFTYSLGIITAIVLGYIAAAIGRRIGQGRQPKDAKGNSV